MATRRTGHGPNLTVPENEMDQVSEISSDHGEKIEYKSNDTQGYFEELENEKLDEVDLAFKLEKAREFIREQFMQITRNEIQLPQWKRVSCCG